MKSAEKSIDIKIKPTESKDSTDIDMDDIDEHRVWV
jgi:hypothetical protein